MALPLRTRGVIGWQPIVRRAFQLIYPLLQLVYPLLQLVYPLLQLVYPLLQRVYPLRLRILLQPIGLILWPSRYVFGGLARWSKAIATVIHKQLLT